MFVVCGGVPLLSMIYLCSLLLALVVGGVCMGVIDFLVLGAEFVYLYMELSWEMGGLLLVVWFECRGLSWLGGNFRCLVWVLGI